MTASLKSLLIEARTCRRFQADYAIPYNQLEDLVDMARITPSARNAQVLRYAIIQNPEVCQEISSTYVLGGALKPEERPEAHQAPAAYIVILAPDNIDDWNVMDIGIAAQTIQLGATEKGLGACMVGSFNANKLLDILKAQGLNTCDTLFSVLKKTENEEVTLQPRILMALGKPTENRVIVDIPENRSTVYFRKDDDHFVPKRDLNDILILKI